MKSPFGYLCLAALLSIGAGQLHAAPIPAGWTCVGTCGTLGADGVVSLSPLGNPYQYVTTAGGPTGAGALPSGPLGSETNGSTLSTSIFTATAGTELNFYFNYVTSDGAGYADYAWAALFDSSNNPVSLLFTARTLPSGTIVPGNGMPDPNATLAPASVPIIGGGPVWSPLGSDSGRCYDAGCGYTGWINSNYIIPDAGDYYLKVGVVNWIDQLYASGLALDGVTVDGVPINPTSPVPEPSTFLLLGSGMAGAVSMMRRRIFNR
ncbi:MAG TPA: NF038132 family protein [Edaphobacter sp.]